MQDNDLPGWLLTGRDRDDVGSVPLSSHQASVLNFGTVRVLHAFIYETRDDGAGSEGGGGVHQDHVRDVSWVMEWSSVSVWHVCCLYCELFTFHLVNPTMGFKVKINCLYELNVIRDRILTFTDNRQLQNGDTTSVLYSVKEHTKHFCIYLFVKKGSWSKH